MKKLHLIRHAKSSWSDRALSDIDRPLNQRGLRSCALMAEQIVKAGCSFEHVFCSPALRAQSTIENIAQHLNLAAGGEGDNSLTSGPPSSKSLRHRQIEWHTDPALYTFVMTDLLAWCQQLDNSLSEVVIVGHNSAMTDFVNAIGNQPLGNLPTCGYVQLALQIEDWRALSPGAGDTISLLTPKMFK